MQKNSKTGHHKKTKIIFAVTNDLSTDQRVHKVITSLLKKNTDITLVGRKLPNSIPLSRSYQTVRFRLPFTRGPLFYATFNLRLFFYLLFSRFDLVVANDLDTLPGSYCAMKIRRKKLVYDSHEYFTEVPELHNRPTVKKIWLWIEKIILPSIQISYTVCNSIASVYNKKYGIKMQVIHNYPNKSRIIQKQKTNKNKQIILYQGMLNMGRGIELAIASMQYTSDDMRLWIIGDGYMKESLKKQILSLHLQEKVLLHGKICEPELSQYTQQASIGLSIEEDIAENYRYALPNKLFSYLEAGIPVIVSDLPEMKQVVTKYEVGSILTERKPEKLAMLYKIMLDKLSYKHYKKKITEAANEFIWENQEEKLYNIYDPYLHD